MKSTVLLPFSKDGLVLVKDLTKVKTIDQTEYKWEFLRESISLADVNALSTCNRLFSANFLSPIKIKQGDIVYRFNVDKNESEEIRTIGCIIQDYNTNIPSNKWCPVCQLRNVSSADLFLIPKVEQLFLDLEQYMNIGVNSLYSLRGGYGYIPSDIKRHT